MIDEINSEQHQIANCYSSLINDTLILGNSFIERRFKWNNGDLISIDILNKKTGKTIKIQNAFTPEFSIKNLDTKPEENTYNSTVIKATPIISSYLTSEIITKYEGIEVKRFFVGLSPASKLALESSRSGTLQ